ncbi:TetR/AcrR family transcriptional regulator [Intestinibacter sp.]|uniref:TetR/AcrR family transcriptional regulator n=1 Tax=Intestinibacter sp. TaxID=1965304 RepID=UPI003F160A2E
MKKQPEITNATRKKIIDSFWMLLQEMEIEKITVNQISEKAGIHRSSFYRYYSDIYAVFEEFEHQLLTSISTEIEEIRKDIVTKDLKKYINKTATVLIKYADKLYRLLNNSCGEGLKKKLLENLRRNIMIMFDLSDSQEDIDYYVTFIGTMMLMNLNYWYERQDQYTYQEINAKGQMIVEEGLMKLQMQEKSNVID